MTLGPSLVTTHGYSNPEVGETYARALLLSRRSVNNNICFPSWVVGCYSTSFAPISKNRDVLRRIASIRPNSKRMRRVEMAGHFLLGTSLFHMGQLAASREQIQHALHADVVLMIRLWRSSPGPTLMSFAVLTGSRILAIGNPDEAVENGEQAVALARDLSHPFTLAIALDYAAMFSVYVRRRIALSPRLGSRCRLP